MLLSVIWCLVIGVSTAYALNLDKIKTHFLSGDYKSAVSEGEKILAACGSSVTGADELYYILGLSYLEEENFLRASDIFEIILREFKNSGFREEARLGLGDTYFLRSNFLKAEECYQELIRSYPYTKLKAQIYYRLSQIGFKKGDTQAGKEYLDKLRQSFPLNPELMLNKDLLSLKNSVSDLYYTVQIGSFSKNSNAENLAQKLMKEGWPAYLEEAYSQQGEKIYRLRVGKFRLRQEAQDLEKRLSAEGYPTKIFP